MWETIREYLVGLGFKVDNNSFNTAKKAMDTMESNTNALVSTLMKGFGQAAVAVAAFGVAAATASVKFLNGLANQQIQMQILSRQLWTTEQQANAFNATLKAMGTNLQDLYLSPTLMSQYQQLHAVATQLSTPGDYNQQIQQIQNLKLQLEQMRVEAYYALQWIGYWFVKYMSGPINNVKNVLQQINAVIIKQMPTWTKQAAQWMASFWQAAVQIITGITNVYHWLQKIGSYIPGWAKGIGAALALIAVSNPFMLFVEGIAAAMLLWNDFQTYLKDPSKSAFPQLWAWVEKITNGFKGLKSILTGILGTIAGFAILKRVISWLKAARIVLVALSLDNPFGLIITAIGALIAGLVVFDGKSKKAHAAIQKIGQAFNNVWGAIKNVMSGIGHLYNALTNHKNRSNMQGFFTLLTQAALTAAKGVAMAVDEIASLVNVAGYALHGNWTAAKNALQNIFTGQNMVNDGLIPQSMVAGGKKPTVGPPSYPYMFQSTSISSSSSSKTANSHATTVNAPLSITNNNYGNTNSTATNQQMSNHFNKLMHNLRPTY